MQGLHILNKNTLSTRKADLAFVNSAVSKLWSQVDNVHYCSSLFKSCLGRVCGYGLAPLVSSHKGQGGAGVLADSLNLLNNLDKALSKVYSPKT